MSDTTKLDPRTPEGMRQAHARILRELDAEDAAAAQAERRKIGFQVGYILGRAISTPQQEAQLTTILEQIEVMLGDK